MAAIDDLLLRVEDPDLRARLQQEFAKLSKQKKFGLVFEEHLPECTPLYEIPVKVGALVAEKGKDIKNVFAIISINDGIAKCANKTTKEVLEIPVESLVTVAEFGEPIYPQLIPMDAVENAPDSDLWHTLIQADNFHALQLLEYLYAGQVDCIYIDPPYNTGAKDWKYNNDYVDGSDQYRHSKWLSMMQKRLKIAKKLLNPTDSVLIVTIDEKEYLHLGCLLAEMFPEANIQMITDVINPRGTNRENEFSRVEEYIFVCQIGNASVNKSENNMLGNTDEVAKARVWFGFNRGNNFRKSANRQFYPIYIDEKERKIIQIGEPMSLETHPEDFPKIDGLVSVFPINDRGNESIWRSIPETTREWVKRGYVKVSQYDKKHQRWTLAYIPSGLQARIENGEINANNRCEDGSLDLKQIESNDKKVNPRSVWVQKYHNATDYGATIIKNIIPNHQFSYPKSLYSVYDILWFFTANKPNALIVDFFAGSGTTLHAVNLLNAEDGGHRRCIMVTNNEVSADEAKLLTAQGLHPGDDEWEKLGIAQYVTWPRTVCSIEGHDINGNPLKGNYIGSDIPMADGFKANCAFFKLGFLDKNAVALGLQFKELLPILWMKAGAKGKCPIIDGEGVPEILIFPKNEFAVLSSEKAYMDFEDALAKHPEIQTVYIVTDSEQGYKEMIKNLNVKRSFQLYRDYLDNFRINTRR